MIYAPIALFVYNRPEHTRQTVEALKKNDLADKSDLYIYSDAAKSTEQEDAVNLVREYVRKIDGFKSVTIIEQKINFGLAKSIIEGVTSIVNEFGRIIVLEDDLVTSPYFLQYMNIALSNYKDNEEVMSVSGYMFPIENKGLPETFFLSLLGCWGWATWDRAWKHFHKDSKALINTFKKETIYRFNLEGAFDFWAQVRKNEEGTINTWAIFWYASVFKNNGLCLHPAVSMVINIGNDGSGIHCNETNKFYSELANKPIVYYESNFAESMLARQKTRLFLLSTKPKLFIRVYSKLKFQISYFFKLLKVK